MTRTTSASQLDPIDEDKLELLHAAFVELFIGPESDDVLVQVAFHALLAWLRGEVAEPRALLEAFGSLEGPLGRQLAFVGSLLRKRDDARPAELPRVWWWVVKAAYYRRWQELTDPRFGSPGRRQPPA
jgi:hypothetical protein